MPLSFWGWVRGWGRGALEESGIEEVPGEFRAVVREGSLGGEPCDGPLLEIGARCPRCDRFGRCGRHPLGWEAL